MPTNTQQAVQWALTQTDSQQNQITKDTPQGLVDKVREYFNTNNISYSNFSFADLKSYL